MIELIWSFGMLGFLLYLIVTEDTEYYTVGWSIAHFIIACLWPVTLWYWIATKFSKRFK